MKKLLFIKTILIIFILSTCFLNHARGQESKSKFNKPVFFQTRDTLWTIDTLGCLGYRDKQASIILDNEKAFIGKSESEIKEILGEPTYTQYFCNESRFVYYLNVSPDCENIYSKKLTWKEIEAGTGLDFVFNKEGKLTGIAWWVQ